jgi:MYXO-CTERM domain-containing protein
MNKCVLGAIAVSAISAASASADVFFDRASFDAANPGLPVLDFEGIAPDGGFLQPAPDFSGFGVSFTESLSGTGDGIAISDSGFFFATPTDVLFVNIFDAQLIMTFDPGVAAAGFDVAIGFGGLGATVDVYDLEGGLLESESFDTQDLTIFTTFIGFSGLGDIGAIVVTPVSGGFVLIDNLAFGGIPAPGAVALFALAGLASRRRRSA